MITYVNYYSFRDSGIGDHGVDGMNAFLSQHKCSYICRGIKLATLGAAVEIVDYKSDSSEDDQKSDDGAE